MPNQPNDGYSGGPQSVRDTTGQSGGWRGNVNSASYTHTIAGADVIAFEWNALMVLDNYAIAGENCAAYVQGNKHSIGPTWGLCVETCDTSVSSTGGLVSLEIDQWVAGRDNGQRVAVDIVLGDAGLKRGMPKNLVVEATAAIRIGQSAEAPQGQWATGIDLSKANCKTAIQLSAWQSVRFGPVSLLPLLYLTTTCSIVGLGLSLLNYFLFRG